MRKSVNTFGSDIPKHVVNAMRKELEDDGILRNSHCRVWFDDEKQTIKGIGQGSDKRTLTTSGKKDIYKSWHDVVMDFKSDTTLDDVKKITSKYGYTILE